MEQLIRVRTRLEGEQMQAALTFDRLAHDTSRRRILAPVSGHIGEVRAISVGSVVEEGDVLAAVIPPGDLQVVADFVPSSALGRLQPGQAARLRLDRFHWSQYGTVAARVARVATEVHRGRVRVELTVEPEPNSAIALQHGLTGTLEIEVERVAPIALVLRAAGKLLARPTTTRTAMVQEG